MQNENKQLIKTYYHNVLVANTEMAKKELLKKLLVQLFGQEPEANEILDKMSLGAEKAILEIPHKLKSQRGFADTQYDTIIIEFEKSMQRTWQHAREQLSDYLAGNWGEGKRYDFTLIATDCIVWKVYAPSYEEIIENKRVELIETDHFELNEDNAEGFYYFLDRYLFRYTSQPATLENIKLDFGETSAIFLNSVKNLKDQFEKSYTQEEVKLQYEEWLKFLSYAYGSFKGSHEVFLVHTYLSVFAKILAYTILTGDEFIDDDELKGIIKGDIFEKHNVKNFIDRDFYYWVTRDDAFDALKPMFRSLAQKINAYDFKQLNEDVLKGVYQELIDLETRHALGEYYTPDWLCEKIVSVMPVKRGARVLDPACGSGSFLRAAIDKLKRDNPRITADELAESVVGIDIHPLSVQISKTTVLLALGHRIKQARKPVILNVYLANTLLLKQADIRLTGHEYAMNIDRKDYHIDISIFENANLFDKAVHVCDKLAEISKNKRPESKDTLKNSLEKETGSRVDDDTIINSFYAIYLGIKLAKEESRNSIWKFILQNIYKPFFFRQGFDVIVGNPPWLTYSGVKSKKYQDMLFKQAESYRLVPKSADMPHLELAAIFLSHAAYYFLAPKGKIAFVLPRSFLTASHHCNTRVGRARGFAIKSIWDLSGVSPLFRIPACTLIAEKSEAPPGKPKSAIAGLNIKGRLKNTDSSWAEAEDKLSFEKVEWRLVTLGANNAFSTDSTSRRTLTSVNEYKDKFMQGATIVPRNFYFVELTQEKPKSWSGRLVTVRSSSDVRREAKEPWKSLPPLEGRMDTCFLFSTALSKNILPFGYIDLPLVALPIQISRHTHKPVLLDSKELKREGYLEASEWFHKVEEQWVRHRTEKNAKTTSLNYLNWADKLTLQAMDKKYVVIYTASAKDANAVVIKREDIDLPFIVESKAYWHATNNLREAYYLTGFLNSNYANKAIKAFQTTGLFGPRDIHKRILDVPLPKYDSEESAHVEIAEKAMECHKFVHGIVDKKVGGHNVGLLRSEIRAMLAKELDIIDTFLRKII
jgi:hypothetical protein